MRISALVLVVLVAALAYTNPGMDAFESHIENEAATLIRDEIGSDSWLSDALGNLAGSALADRADEYTTRANYLVASVYTIDADDDGRPELQWLGVADRFIQLDTEE